ncbi:hypothetical protein OOT00_15590, partial [Desulfobotulus sp. H1]
MLTLQLKKITFRLNRYAVFLIWLLKDSLWRDRWLASAVLAASVLGVVFQIKVFGLILYYARFFSSGELIHIGPYAFDPRSSSLLLMAGSAMVVVFLSLSALFIYFSRKKMLFMGRRYEEFCAKRIFSLLASKGIPDRSVLEGPGEVFFLRLIKSDSRLAGRVLRMILSLVVPALTFSAAAALLVYLETVLTCAVMFLGIIYLYYQYLVSKSAAAYSVIFEKNGPAASKAYKLLLQDCMEQPGNNGCSQKIDSVFLKDPVKKQLDAYVGRLKASETSRFISGLFMAVIIGLILVVMGSAIILEGAGWGRLLI